MRPASAPGYHSQTTLIVHVNNKLGIRPKR
ncbi:hypothetical protein ABID62_003804 [Bradyrhizobium sp. S3.9.1]|jgi:hypothetical protein